MRILQLHFKNLNSLVGEWRIDFTDPAYVANGIFAITGPTGAGKSTVLDAIALALYGATPRLGRVTAKTNELMARQTGVCFAELEFETVKGHFRCHWSQHRSRKKAQGELQPPKHEIVNAQNNHVIESQLRKVREKVEEISGMDFDRFTRSMLLAQNGFAAFLRAKPDERAPILERITGTAIYSDISRKVHDLTTEQQHHLTTLKSGLDGISLLTEEERADLETQLNACRQQAEAYTKQHHTYETQYNWRKTLDMLEQSLMRLEGQLKTFEADNTRFSAQLASIDPALKAQALAGYHATVVQLRKDQATDLLLLKTHQQQLPHLFQKLQENKQALKKATTEHDKAQLQLETDTETFKKVRILDLQHRSGSKLLTSIHSDIATEQSALDVSRRQQTTLSENIEQAKNHYKQTELYLSTHIEDEALNEQLSGIRQRLKIILGIGQSLDDINQKIHQATAQLTQAKHNVNHDTSTCQQAEQRLKMAQSSLVEMERQVTEALNGRTKQEWVEEQSVLLTRVYQLEKYKEKTEDYQTNQRNLQHLTTQLANTQAQTIGLIAQEKAQTQQIITWQQVIEQLDKKLSLLKQVRSLEQHRMALQSGDPCPLCGARDHPYVTDQPNPPDETETELGKAKKRQTESRQKMLALSRTLAKSQRDQEKVTEAIQDATRQKTESQATLRAISTEFGLQTELGLQTALDTLNIDELRQIIDQTRYDCQQRQTDSKKALRLVQEKETDQNQAKKMLDSCLEACNVADKKKQGAQHQQYLAEQILTQIHSTQEEKTQFLHQEQDYLRHSLVPFKLDLTLDPQSQIDLLETRRQHYQLEIKRKADLEQQLAQDVVRLQQSEIALSTLEGRLQSLHDRSVTQMAQMQQLQVQRQQLFADKDPDHEEQLLKDRLRAGENVVRKTEAANQSITLELSHLQAQIDRSGHTTQIRAQEIDEKTRHLQQQFESAGFMDETEFLQAHILNEDLQQLIKQRDDLQLNETRLESEKQRLLEAHKTEFEKQLTEADMTTIIQRLAETTQKLTELNTRIGAIGQQRKDADAQSAQSANHRKDIEQQQKICDSWEQLHHLIGSADGKKFRNFAQGLTFELMVNHANQQLRKMSDRYLLIRDRHQPLDLNVIDHYQAGEVRATKNLSGGESFIVSLALALGLSKMASRHIRIDSLFLDEGFGVLDEDALETALDTLSELDQEGKVIGIISHVPALKERISTQLKISPGMGGRSYISGPGVHRL